MMGTRKRVHGKSEKTAVPRETLVEALLTRTKNRLYSTASIDTGTDDLEKVVVEVAAKLTGSDPFEYQGPRDIEIPVADPTTELARH